MADLYWIEGCEGHGTSGAAVGLEDKYNGPESIFIGGADVIAGKNFGQAWSLSEILMQTPAIMLDPEVTMGFWFRQTTNSTVLNHIAKLWKTTGEANGVSLNQNSGGGINTGDMFLRIGFTNVGTATGFSPVLNTWYYIHLYCLIHASTGILKAYVDGTEIASFTGDTTQGGANFQYASILCSNREFDIDDFYVASGDFRVEPEVHTVMPDINGSVIQFTSSSGPNNNTVDDDPPDDDTTYNESNSSGNRDLFDLFDLSSNLGIVAMQLNSRSKAITANHNLKLVVKSDSAEDVSGDFEVGTAAYEHQYYINQIDPNTSASWLKDVLNAAEFGYEDGGAA